MFQFALDELGDILRAHLGLHLGRPFWLEGCIDLARRRDYVQPGVAVVRLVRHCVSFRLRFLPFPFDLAAITGSLWMMTAISPMATRRDFDVTT